MSKKIIISLSIIGAIAAVVGGATIALFNDTETSAGNILIAGEMDLQVDHTWQTYNDVECNTCDLTLISDLSNMVVAKNGVAFVDPYPAVYVGSNSPFFIHSAWTAQNDPILSAANAEWIWESDPTKTEDLTNNAIYTLRKTFEWYGPVITSDLWFAVGSDNSVEVWLNGTKIGENTGEYGYREGSMLHIPSAAVTGLIGQGENILEFKVKNWALAGSTIYTNPAGLIYKFYLSGNCQDSYFRSHCNLWGLKDLEPGDTFWNFNDIKPGDHGTNIISLHAYNNDASACLFAGNVVDLDNTLTEPELALSDTLLDGELSPFIEIFAWEDTDHDNVYDTTETVLISAGSPLTVVMYPAIALQASHTKFVGLAWCAGTQTVIGDVISCNGSTMGNIAQTDSFTADLTAYAEQQRNNGDFRCPNVIPN